MNNQLLSKWKAHYTHLGIDPESISIDGKINKDKYDDEKGILFILKETNDYKGGSLSELLKSGPKYQMWHTLAKWAAGLLNDFPAYDIIDNKECLRNSLHQVAVVNLKKKAGGSSASMSQINAFTHQDKELLLEQIKLLDPKIIIACGTLQPLIWLLDIDVVNAEMNKVLTSKLLKTPIIPWMHPNRKNANETYNSLKILCSQFRTEMLS